MKSILIKEIDLKDLPVNRPLKLDEYPIITKEDYSKRIDNLIKTGNKYNYTHYIIYGDREHYSNIKYFTGFDPRFEESLLLIDIEKNLKIILGKEGMDYADIIPLDIDKELYETFGLLGQTRNNSRKLFEILKDFGLKEKSKVALIGWKHFNETEFDNPSKVSEIPHYIVEEIVKITKNIENGNRLLMGNDEGLRHTLDLKEMYLHEIASTKSSRSVFNVIQNLEKGITEMEASKNFNIDGMPLQTHPNLNFGFDNSMLGVASPTHHRKLQYGDLIGIGMGYRRSQVHRFGVFARNENDYGDKHTLDFYSLYFKAIAHWYESIKIGVTGDQVYRAMENILGDLKEFGVNLNPGHLIHTDEWTNTFFNKNSEVKVRSRMAIQCDMISMNRNKKLAAHIEDGIIVADKSTRQQYKKLYPKSWERIQYRRKFMIEVLGINLSNDILPLSDMIGIHPPFMSDISKIFVKENTSEIN